MVLNHHGDILCNNVIWRWPITTKLRWWSYNKTEMPYDDILVTDCTRSCGWGWGLFWYGGHLRPCGRVLKSLYGHHLKNPIFSNLGLCAVCWAHFTCHHELWPTSVGHPFSFLNSSWGLTGENITRSNITIAIFRFVLQDFTIPGYIIFYRYLFSLCLHVAVFLLQYVALLQSVN